MLYTEFYVASSILVICACIFNNICTLFYSYKLITETINEKVSNDYKKAQFIKTKDKVHNMHNYVSWTKIDINFQIGFSVSSNLEETQSYSISQFSKPEQK